MFSVVNVSVFNVMDGSQEVEDNDNESDENFGIIENQIFDGFQFATDCLEVTSDSDSSLVKQELERQIQVRIELFCATLTIYVSGVGR